MLCALESKNKERFIDGSFPSPLISDPLREAWRRCDRMVKSWLMRSMSPPIARLVSWFETSAEIWKDIRDRFSHGDKFRIADLQEDIHICKQGDSSVSDYFTRLKNLWKELEMFRSPLVCSCASPCACGILFTIKKEREDDYIIKFLRGLNDEFSQVRSQVMLMEPMPSLSKTFSLVLQREREFGTPLPPNPAPQSTAFANFVSENTKPLSFNRGSTNSSRGGGRGGRGGGGRGNRICTHCGKNNHTIDTCFFIHGFLEGYKKPNKTSTSPKPSVNLTEIDPNVTPQGAPPEGNSQQDQLNFLKEQYQQILTFLEQSKEASSSANNIQSSIVNSMKGNPSYLPFWILDSGATDHICPSKNFFIKLNSIKPIPIRLPNKSVVSAQFLFNWAT
jgi:hypothetical protein